MALQFAKRDAIGAEEHIALIARPLLKAYLDVWRAWQGILLRGTKVEGEDLRLWHELDFSSQYGKPGSSAAAVMQTANCIEQYDHLKGQ